MPLVNVEPARGWSSKPFAPGYLNREAVNCHVAQGEPRWDRGYRILKQIQSGIFTKGGGSFSHRHTDGTYWPFFWFDGSWYRLTLAGGVFALVGALGNYFVPEVVHFPAPGGVSAGFIGDNTKAYGFRKEAELEEFLWDLPAPTGTIAETTPATGSLAAGTYHVAVTQIDDTGARVVESGPLFKLSIAVALNDRISLDLSGVAFATRATKYRVYVTAANGADAATAYFQFGADTAKATTTFDIATNTAGTAIPHRLTLYQQAVLAVAAVRSACVYEERLCYGSEGSPYVFFSERADINHYYATNVLNGFGSPITALATGDDALYVFTADAIWQVTGDLGRNEDNTIRFRQRILEPGLGCTSRGSVVAVPEVGVFFMSQFGPCVIVNGTVIRLGHDHFADAIPRLDFDYFDRVTACFDQRLRQYLCFVPRKVNASRITDGAANAGICDWGIRWNLDEISFSPPLHLEVTHVRARAHVATPGTAVLSRIVAATGPHGDALKLHETHAAGVSGDVSIAKYDEIAPSAFSATSATVAGTGYGTLQGVGVTFHYPSTDANYPDETTYRTIKSSSEAGGNTTINWDGDAPLPSGTKPTVQVAATLGAFDVHVLPDPRMPTAYSRLNHVLVAGLDIVGQESRS